MSNFLKPMDKVFKKGVKVPLIFSSLSLFIGMFLFIVSFFFFSFIDSSIFFSKAKDKYYVISKEISLLHTFNKNESYFNAQEISEIKKINGVNRVSKVYTSEFPCRIYISGATNLYSEIFLESIENQFLSVDTSDFNWKPDQKTIPMVISNEFLLFDEIFQIQPDIFITSETALRPHHTFHKLCQKKKIKTFMVNSANWGNMSYLSQDYHILDNFENYFKNHRSISYTFDQLEKRLEKKPNNGTMFDQYLRRD